MRTKICCCVKVGKGVVGEVGVDVLTTSTLILGQLVYKGGKKGGVPQSIRK